MPLSACVHMHHLSFQLMSSPADLLFTSQAQLTSSNSALAAAREEVKKLEMQLLSQQKKSENSEGNLRQQHQKMVQRLEERVSLWSTVPVCVVPICSVLDSHIIADFCPGG